MAYTDVAQPHFVFSGELELAGLAMGGHTARMRAVSGWDEG